MPVEGYNKNRRVVSKHDLAPVPWPIEIEFFDLPELSDMSRKQSFRNEIDTYQYWLFSQLRSGSAEAAVVNEVVTVNVGIPVKASLGGCT